MNKPNIRKWAIALFALASLSLIATSNAGGKGQSQPGKDRGGLRGGTQPRPILIGNNTADGPLVISNGRGRGGGGGGRGGHDDPSGHH